MAHDESNKVRRVAVIGAGAAGLVAAQELNREGHELVVFEQADHVGGTWVYDPQVETDPLGLDPARTVIHSSIYLSLRTNLPREVMGFRDYPFKVVEGRDCRRLPGHKEVALYLQDFAAEFRLLNFIRFRTKVEYVGRDPNNQNQWIVRSNTEKRDVIEELYDAVVVCSGHHTQPRVAEIPGIDKWPGKQIHSHNYRVPAPFQDQVVIVIGNSASGEDISRELASVAKEVHVSDRSITSEVIMRENLAGPGNISLHPMIEYVCEDGTVMFRDGYSIVADTIIHCTGYSYHFPFLETEGIVTMNDNCVGPLYEHVFPPVLAPSLSFVGLPWQVAPLSVCELQSRWIAKTLSGKTHLPSENDMIEAVRNLYAQNEAAGRPKHYTHNIGHCQSEYVNWLADQCGCARVEDWWENVYALTFKYRASHPQTYRDEWEYHYSLEIALKGLSNGIDKWPGKQIHSHNYRVPAPFQDQVVIVIGNAASGEDISNELMSVAKEVHLSARSITSEVIMREQLAAPGNLSLHPMIEYVCEDGTVRFQDGRSIIADTIIHCTGYYYHFPFLETEGIVSVNDNCVGPLYQHVFPPVLAPSLSFVGLPWKVVPFPLCELQSRWIAKTLSRKAHLPSKHDMIEAVRNFYVQNEAAGRPKHYTHNIGHCQFEYDDWLADQCGCAHVEDWRKNIYAASGKNKVSHPRTYRDEWEDHYWLEIALLDLLKRGY